MTPEPALWNWRSRGLVSGGTSKNRRKNGSSSSGLRWPGFSLIVPRVAMLTTAGDTRLTMGASEGIGAASAADAGGCEGAGEAGGEHRRRDCETQTHAQSSMKKDIPGSEPNATQNGAGHRAGPHIATLG